MDKWIVATLLYLTVLIGGFTFYEEFVSDDKQAASAEAVHGGGGDNHAVAAGESHGHQGEAKHGTHSEVNVFVQSDEKELKIFLKDKAGNPVEQLEVNHEKRLHFIVVDERLQQYHHLHPEQTGKGEFRIANPLPAGFYKAFVDIKPTNMAYQVAPVPFVVGQPGHSAEYHAGLVPDEAFTRTVEGESVSLQLSAFQPNVPVTLKFELDQTNLTPYLGAMGHVVILDEHAQTFLHVHPANDQEPVFETQFTQPGVYKIWAEFKQGGKVRAFPYVVEIKGE
ncbi:hypothetical protein [Brevibacillus migulae]|uniref:hypothetical protein n=1 Tax=Brevibacillus migulae TaxID=1644114 RepID=UPI00106E453B|nr:hypothetical protein [Brevibacillus migulae]